jgi:class 3 adenylate cyclase/tetratricopeptide (TPR) repeat protein
MSQTPEAPQRLAAIVFADMVGYSTLRQSVALESQGEMLKLARQGLERHHGRLVKTMGDGFMAEFPAANRAARFAIELQEALAARNQAGPGERRFRLRIGMHFGDVVARGEEVDGRTVIIAARTEPLAAPGGICMTEQVWQQVREELPRRADRLGKLHLKGLGRSHRFYHLHALGAGWMGCLRLRARLFARWPGRWPVSLVGTALLGLVLGLWSEPLAQPLLDYVFPPTTDVRVDRAADLLLRFDLPGNVAAAIRELHTAMDKASPHTDLTAARAWLSYAHWLRYHHLRSIEDRTQAARISATATNMDSGLAFFVQGLVAVDEGQYAVATNLLNRANQLYSGEKCEVLVKLAEACRRLGNSPGAARYIDQAERVVGKRWNDFNSLGTYYDEVNLKEAARTNCEEAVRLAPDSPFAWQNLEAVLLHADRTNEAMAALDHLLAAHSNLRASPEAMSLRGTIFLNRGDNAAAADSFLAAARARPADYRFWGNAGLALRDLTGRMDEAKACLSNSVEKAQLILHDNPDAVIMAKQGLYQAFLGRTNDSRRSLQQALGLSSNVQAVLDAAIPAYMQLGDKARATALVFWAVENSPEDNAVFSDALEALDQMHDKDLVEPLKRKREEWRKAAKK